MQMESRVAQEALEFSLMASAHRLSVEFLWINLLLTLELHQLPNLGIG
jgi:hypothetical protein